MTDDNEVRSQSIDYTRSLFGDNEMIPQIDEPPRTRMGFSHGRYYYTIPLMPLVIHGLSFRAPSLPPCPSCPMAGILGHLSYRAGSALCCSTSHRRCADQQNDTPIDLEKASHR
jgi:hypothetical protein